MNYCCDYYPCPGINPGANSFYPYWDEERKQVLKGRLILSLSNLLDGHETFTTIV